MLLGRGAPRADDGGPRLRFFRERPFALEERPPLSGATISRRQLLLAAREDGIEFERLGACEVLHNGVRCAGGELRTGDTLSLRDELVLVAVKRPPLAALDGPFPRDKAGVFGHADACGIVGESAAAWRLREDVAFAAVADAHVLVTGSSGTGKELVAGALHALSARAREAFIARSAASFPATLVDAELFGNLRNFPNPGMPERSGLIGAADRGTLFLDEIGELPLDQQAHLLRVLDRSGEYHRLGEATARRSAFRLVAVTNRPVGLLREDFAARFALRLRTPDLDERREDIPLLVRRLVEAARVRAPEIVSRFFDAGSDAGESLRIDPSFVQSLVGHTYRLHVRELDEIVWRSIRESPSDVLLPVSLGVPSAPPPPSPHPSLLFSSVQDPPSRPGPLSSSMRDPPSYPGPLSSSVRDPMDAPAEGAVRRALERHHGSASRAYKELGLSSRYALYRLMKKYDISPGDGDTSPHDGDS
jgi:two-component system nitrogen regulation response regulator GlnG/two-component system response regulator HydG